ncbi:PEBP-like protein [Pseudohyphozyma bogoriensis]|nr:PEBP-like protein [Pseudohyphozyma bogoriensis]
MGPGACLQFKVMGCYVSFSADAIAGFKRDDITEPFIPAGFTPSLELQATFPNNLEVKYGNVIGRLESAPAPTFAIPGGDPTATYTILCADPDAPARGFLSRALSPICHLIQQEVTVDASGVVTAPPAVVFWGPPGPPPFTGLHRYIFLLYKNTTPEGVLPLEKQSTVKGDAISNRMKWDIKLFVKENGLELVGVNWFQARR